MVPLVPEGTQVLAGLETGGIAVVTALGLRSGPAVRVRPEGIQALWDEEWPPGRWWRSGWACGR
jgi:hypothetical protein